MVTLNKKAKIVIATVAVVAVVLAVVIPFTAADTIANNTAANIKTVTAQGNICQKVDGNTIKFYPADLTLTLQPTAISGTIKRFDVTGGTLATNGLTYTFTGGKGGVLTGRHAVLLQAQGTSADAQAVTLKLAARYSYSWLDSQVELKIGARLLTPDGNYTLLLKSTITT